MYEVSREHLDTLALLELPPVMDGEIEPREAWYAAETSGVPFVTDRATHLGVRFSTILPEHSERLAYWVRLCGFLARDVADRPQLVDVSLRPRPLEQVQVLVEAWEQGADHALRHPKFLEEVLCDYTDALWHSEEEDDARARDTWMVHASHHAQVLVRVCDKLERFGLLVRQ